MPAKLLYRDAQGQDAAVDIPEAAPLFLGRAADCAIRTDDAMVSRKNCKLTFVGGKFVVEDLGSSNGTFVNERRIQKQQLNHGDVVRCGSLQVRYVEVAANVTTGPTGPVGSPTPMPRASASEVAQPHLATSYQPQGPQGYGQANPTGPTPLVQVQPQGGGADPALLVEKDAQIATLTSERDEAKKALKDVQTELDGLRTKSETSDNELKRLRIESSTARDELSKVRREAGHDKEELTAVQRVVDDMRREMKQTKEELLNLKSKTEEQREDLVAKDRQLERAQEDIQKTKKTIDELRAKMSEQQKTKDEGWRELNAQLSQLEQLREVIQEQERILEERRVGLIAIESAAKDLRAEKERLMLELVDTKNQRDDLRDKHNRQVATIEGLEEEHRRLARAMGGGGSGGEEMTRVSGELRDAKMELRKLESEKQRSVEALQRAEQDRDKAAEERDRLDMERQNLLDEKKAAEEGRSKAEQARLKAESARKRLEEEKEQLTRAAAGGGDTDELERKVTKAESRAQDLSDEVEKLKRLLASAQKAPAPAASANGDGSGEIKAKAKEVYEGINEALSELRTTIMTAKGLFGEIAPTVKDEDARGAIAEAITNSMERAEDAKGLLRGLRELAQD